MTTETLDAVTTTTTTETPEPRKELSLRDELSAAVEIQEKGEESSDLSSAARTLALARKGKVAPPKAEVVKAAPEADAKAAMAPEERAKVEAEEKKKAEDAAQAKTLEAPTHWPAADREMFAKQTPEAKQWLLRRHKDMEADYTKRSQDLAGTKRLQETLAEVFQPYREEMALNGIDEAAAIRQLVAAHGKLQKDPAGGIKYLAQQYGLDLKGLVEGAAAADPAGESPTVKALREQVGQLTDQLKTLTGAQTQQQQEATLQTVEQFAAEKDAQGQLRHPHFDEVASDVAMLLRAARESGQKLTLQDAYDRAVYANPQTREKVLAAKDAERRTKEEAERKTKADAARKAGFDVKGEGAATPVAATTGSVREDLEAAFASGGRV